MNNKVKFSVRIHQGGYTYQSLRRIWMDADRLGYYSATLYDLLNVPTLECWTTLSALASQTSRIRITPLALANTYRHPAVFAKMASTLDVISNGRLEVGIGAGGGRDDHLASGLGFPSTSVRVGMLAESIEMMKRLWTEEQVTFEGSYYALTEAKNLPQPVQKPHPPFLIGGHGERYLFRAVARYADICNVGFEMSLEEHRASLDALRKHCRSVGREPSEIEVSHNTRVVIAGSDVEFDRLVSEGAVNANLTEAEYRASLSRAIAGTPEQCAEQIKRYVDNGITYFFLLFPDPIPTESMELFAREVMPVFAETAH
jgi:alkanesulfonate monooxygenase SsuD/methylene tetrahydromethanopterin reductase-like flavin-dependent oxidoreductase (luciferase family)